MTLIRVQLEELELQLELELYKVEFGLANFSDLEIIANNSSR